ncbi:hypothetical protein ACI3L1_02950 [Deinococcus sp. SM5_A1]|uniref:P-loop NTPase n=1 Tax=Deinococcus sp. SM5_A1 TaxID=3379094 RepID=UPI00385E3FEE
MKKRKIITVKMTGEQFFDALKDKFDLELTEISHSSEEYAFSFGQQFEKVPRLLRMPENHDFFSGHEPVMQDISQGYDALLQETESILEKSIADFGYDSQESESITRMYTLDGSPGSGKSTASARISFNLSHLGYEVFRFREPEEINIDDIVSYLENRNSFLFFDNVGSYRSSIQVIHSKLRETSGRHYIFIADRTRSLSPLRSYFLTNTIDEDYSAHYGELSLDDAGRIVDKISEFGRLDKLLEIKPSKRVETFRRKRSLINAMYSLSHAKPHKDRMLSEFLGLNDETQKVIYILCAALYSQGFKLSLSWLSALTNQSQTTIESIVNGIPSDLIRYETGSEHTVSTVNKVFAEDFMDRKNTSSPMYEEYRVAKEYTLIAFLKWLSKYVDSRHPDLDSRYYRASSRLLDFALLLKWFDTETVHKIYDELRPFWGSNARFWEQYAILALRDQYYDRAMAYARLATKIHEDGFTLNTLGMVLMKSSYEAVNVGEAKSKELLFEGISLLKKSQDAKRGADYPFITFFSHIRHYANKLNGNDPALLIELHTTFNEWILNAKHHPLFQSVESQEDLKKIQLEWFGDFVIKKRDHNATRRNVQNPNIARPPSRFRRERSK